MVILQGPTGWRLLISEVPVLECSEQQWSGADWCFSAAQAFGAVDLGVRGS